MRDQLATGLLAGAAMALLKGPTALAGSERVSVSSTGEPGNQLSDATWLSWTDRIVREQVLDREARARLSL